MEKLVSIIVLNYNSNAYTIECLKSLKNQRYNNFEILLVDNGSKNDVFQNLVDQLSQFDHDLKIKLIRSEHNLYFGAGNNKAIRMAKGEYICLLNNDTEVLPDFIEKMVDFLEKNSQVGMISPKIKLHPDKDYIWTTGGQVNFKTSAVVTNRGYLEYDPLDQKYNKIEPIDFAPGTALFVRKNDLEKFGLIDEIYFMYWEDPDWNFRAKKLGFESYYVPTTIVYHKIPIKRSSNNKRQIFNNFFFKRNKQIFVWKFATLKELFIFYTFFFYNILLESFRELKRKGFIIIILNTIALWKGFWIGLKRRIHQSCRKSMIKDYKYVKRLQNI